MPRRGVNQVPFNFGCGELVFILVIVLIFFGAGKLPDVFRQAGKGIKAFKDASEGKDDDDDEAPRPKAKKQIEAKDDLDDEPAAEKQASSTKKKAEGE